MRGREYTLVSANVYFCFSHHQQEYVEELLVEGQQAVAPGVPPEVATTDQCLLRAARKLISIAQQ